MVGFDLEEFILENSSISTDFSDSLMLDKYIFNESYYTAIIKYKYVKTLIYDNSDFWFWDDFWKVRTTQFIRVLIWDEVKRHFERNTNDYWSILDSYWQKANQPPTDGVKLLEWLKGKEKREKNHPWLLFKKKLSDFFVSVKKIGEADKVLAESICNSEFHTLCNPDGLINIFTLKEQKEWKQDGEDEEEYFEIIKIKTPMCIDLNGDMIPTYRLPEHFMTNELDILVGDTDYYIKEEVLDALTQICNNSVHRMQQVLLGYVLPLKGTNEAYFFSHNGNGSNGKSILNKMINNTLGELVLNVCGDKLLKQAKGGRDKFYASTIGKKLLLVEELSAGGVDIEELKKLSTNTILSPELLYKQFIKHIDYKGRLFFYQQAKLNIDGSGSDGGLERRVHDIPHNSKFVTQSIKDIYPDNDNFIVRDDDLENKIATPEYKNAFFEILMDIIKNKVKMDWKNEFGMETAELLEENQSPIDEWLKDNIIITNDNNKVNIHEIYDGCCASMGKFPIKDLKSKTLSYFKQKEPNTIIEVKNKEWDGRYMHHGKRERGFWIHGCMLEKTGGESDLPGEIDPLDQ